MLNILIDIKDNSSIIRRRPVNLEKTLGKLVHQERRGDFEVDIRKTNDIELTYQSISQLTQSSFLALEIANKISPTIERSVELICNNETSGYITTGMQVSGEMVTDEPDSQTAAILHETMHWLQEDNPQIKDNEILPNIAEFLFTGKKRLDSYFKNLHRNKDRIYSEAWKSGMKILLPDSEGMSFDQMFESLLEKRSLPEDKKVNLIKSAIQKLKSA